MKPLTTDPADRALQVFLRVCLAATVLAGLITILLGIPFA